MELLAGPIKCLDFKLTFKQNKQGVCLDTNCKQTVTSFGSATGNTELRFLPVILFFF
jgi:hypothetical protein